MKSRYYPVILSALSVLLCVVYTIGTTAASSSQNHVLNQLLVEQQQLELQLETLEKEWLSLTSLQQLHDKAALQGFVPVTKTVSLTAGDGLASLTQ